jgi:hypothetical protein
VYVAGVDNTKYSACLSLALNARYAAGCGHYAQTEGELVVEQGASSANFKINIMDDLCMERRLRFLQVTLSVPGGTVLGGESLIAIVRIDDNDFLRDECS